MPRLVLFDIDGTLIRTGGAGIRAFARTSAELLGRPEATRRLSFAGRTDTSLVRELLRGEGLAEDPDSVTRFLAAYLEFLDEELRRHAGECCPGVEEALDRLTGRDGILVGLLTGNVRRGACLKLSAHGIWERFVMGAYGDDHEDRNRLAALARERAGALWGRMPSPEEILVIGDTPLDIACARSIGAPCLAVATGGHSLEDLHAAGAHRAVASLEEVDWSELLAGAPVVEAIE